MSSFFAILAWSLVLPVSLVGATPLRIGSKKFTESVVLAELAQKLLKAESIETIHQAELGGTQIVWKALQRGDIDLYPEYTGTITKELLPDKNLHTFAQIQRALHELGIGITQSLGFNNTYALGIETELARRLSITSISDLLRHPELKFGFSHEFMDRAEGWPAVVKAYGFLQSNVRGLDHDLAYRAMETNEIQVTDLYSTDAEITYYRLLALKDDRFLFPDYQAVYLFRESAAAANPKMFAALTTLEGKISALQMVQMNARAKLDKVPESEVAAEFLLKTLKRKSTEVERSHSRFWMDTKNHLYLVFLSLLATVIVALPLGIFSARYPTYGQFVLAAAGILQTIPSLALLVFMIPILGIGSSPALAALFLYGLLPIIRNTYTGLRNIPTSLLESADALGLSRRARLFRIELPLAASSIFSGIKISAVINVGTATLGALIGAGGYGEPILIGIRRDDTAMLLQGAIPAAVLALLVQGAFDLLERGILPRSLKSPTRK